MPNPKDTHCSHCGAAFHDTDRYPRVCANTRCGAMTWANPVPVSVVLLPVEHEGRIGLLVVRRGIEPRSGYLAIVGGFVDTDEEWQAAGAREVREETGVQIAPSLTPFWFTSTQPRPNRVLLFGVAAQISSRDLGVFEPTNETTERGLVFGPDGLDDIFAFGLHVDAARRWFDAHGITGPHSYVAL